MVDFKKLRASEHQAPATHPVDIFRRLPKPPGINDLYSSQAEVLEAWYARRNERDLVVKLHTGGGKTLVGLLMAQAVLNETREPVIYLAPTVQLVQQVLAKAGEYSVPAVGYEKGVDLRDEFFAAKAVLVCTYQALFHGKCKFGVRGDGKEPVSPAAVLADDAHVAFSTVREQFSLQVKKDKDPEGYAHLTTLFRNDFAALDRVGTFDDVVNGIDYGVLEVPYWSWQAKAGQVREYLRTKAQEHPYQWPFVRDALDYCHCIISRNALVITPLFPLVDLVPAFADCPRRIFMSATIGDDSAIVRTFDASPASIAKPIISKSLAGVSERMILAPELIPFAIKDVPDMLRKLVRWAADKRQAGTVILVPSGQAAQKWQDVATYPETSEKVTPCIKELQEGKSKGPFVFANRYDGIDLPGNACRLLVLAGLPRGMDEYDLYLLNVFQDGSTLNSALAQRIEQGMGRGARGGSDFCVVIVTGKDLIAWLGRSANLKFLTRSTRAQLEIGMEVSRNVSDLKDLAATIQRCLDRDRDWIEYHAEKLAELAEPEEVDQAQLQQAAVERKAFQLMRDGYWEKAIETLGRYCQEAPGLDRKSKGWLTQMAARAAHYWGRTDLAEESQQRAFAENRNLLRPKVSLPYVALTTPGKQAEAIVTRIAKFKHRRGYIAEFDETVAHLTPQASSNQFEQALADLGAIIGFTTDRPEKNYRVGPDVLWLASRNSGLVIEAKSRKNAANALKRDQHGQLLNAAEWFHQTYPDHSCVRVVVHPNVTATKSTVTGQTKALTLDKLQGLISEARTLVVQLCESHAPQEELVRRCEQLLATSSLTPEVLVERYLVPFQVKEERGAKAEVMLSRTVQSWS
jgi:replicative superfamily II helicase